ncbi:flagellar export chaperone FliS [Roseicyclus amphidinii]|jgi:flagellar protein FliS|uniref:flagellar export chaperone FliS n=1 Tax=Roseicyclus amphidinii TaxID=3034232 RepID=UPI0024E0A6AA|nr:flagellar protein FliS [Roseicyclus sp. Amp-Y-6]
MTMSYARSRYRQADAVGQPRIEDPHAVIAVTLTELERALAVLVAAQQAGRSMPGEPCTRALTALYILQSSLDFEKGEDIALGLFELYEYARLQVLAAMRNTAEAKGLAAAHGAMGDILSAWREIAPAAKAGGA